MCETRPARSIAVEQTVWVDHSASPHRLRKDVDIQLPELRPRCGQEQHIGIPAGLQSTFAMRQIRQHISFHHGVIRGDPGIAA